MVYQWAEIDGESLKETLTGSACILGWLIFFRSAINLQIQLLPGTTVLFQILKRILF